jgi:putative ABC transport system substrate-binding protein
VLFLWCSWDEHTTPTHGDLCATLGGKQPIKFDLMINLNTAKSLGIEVPQTLLAIADEIIE